jgi:polysaccharide biosynthesis/export protein
MKRLGFLLFTVSLLAACQGPKKVIYFNQTGTSDTVSTALPTRVADDIIVQPDDILAINVSSIQSLLDKNISQLSIYNSGGTPFSVLAVAGATGASAASTAGYLVDAAGEITFPVIGRVKVGGLTITQVKQALATQLESVVKNPVVEARIINYKVTVLGEVLRPGPILAPNQKITIIDAIAAAGDIPITGRKDNVRVIREVNGQRQVAYLNLNETAIFNSPYYYLHQNDIVVVDPVKIRRQENNEFVRFYLPVITSLLSAALAVYGITQLANK